MLIGALLLQVATLCGAACAQSRELTEAYHALYRGEYGRASQIARQYLKGHPGSAAMHVVLARAELTTNRPEQAIAELRKALAADPRNVDAHYYLWLAAKTQAQQEYQKFFAMAPDYYSVHQLMGEAALAADRPTEAENEFPAALDAKPNSLEVLAELGNLKRSQSKYDEAIGYIPRRNKQDGSTMTSPMGWGSATPSHKNMTAQSITLVSRFASILCRLTPGWLSAAPGFRTENSRRRSPSSSAPYSSTLI
jgi:tetratricopeptide (TPR) repeat protein